MAYLERDERRIHYQFLSGPTPDVPLVIYQHGLLMDNLSSAYFTFAHTLSASAHVLLYDLCGHGRSSVTSSGYSINDHLSDLEALLEHIRDELISSRVSQPLRAFFIGCSYGGALALASARRVESLPGYHPLGVALLEGHLGHEEFTRQLRVDLSATGARADALIARHFEHWLHRESGRKRARLAKRAHQLIYESTLLDDLEVDPIDLEAHVLQLEPPIFALYGASSDALAPAQALLNRRRDVGALHDELIRFEGCTHALLWEATEEVTRALELALTRALEISSAH